MRITKIFEVLFELWAVLAAVGVLCYGAVWHIGTFVVFTVLALLTRAEYNKERRGE